jgi:hypothetical protein
VRTPLGEKSRHVPGQSSRTTQIDLTSTLPPSQRPSPTNPFLVTFHPWNRLWTSLTHWIHSWDDWVPQDRLRKLTDDNKELAANLRRELTQQLQPKSAKPAATSKSRKQGSEFGSGRGSEERHSSVPAGGRGTKRGRDNDIEKVRGPFPVLLNFVSTWTSFGIPWPSWTPLNIRLLGQQDSTSRPLVSA